MPNIFCFSTFTETRRSDILRYNGSYLVKLRTATIDGLNAKSKGFSGEQLSILAGRACVLFSSFYEEGSTRFRVIPEQFTNANERAMFTDCEGSFNASALSRAYSCSGINDYLSRRWAGVCLDCGQMIQHERNTHDCGAMSCTCGNALTEDDMARGICRDCYVKKLWKVYGYHHRPNHNNPIFEKPEKRATCLHLGVEIEIGGSSYFCYDNEDVIKPLSDALNDYNHPERAFIEFETDGSINEGVECITAPTTFDGLNRKAKGFEQFYKSARDNGGEFGRVNGLHFHLDRKYFGDAEETAKAGILLEYFVCKYYDFFATISGRKAGGFSYARKKERAGKGIFQTAVGFSNTAHSYAFNSEPANTYEIRIFGGKIDNEQKFLAVADIVQALGKWAKYTSFESAQKCTPSHIVKYIKNATRVFAYVTDGLNPYSPHTGTGDADLTAFAMALKNTIEGGNV